jgi:chromosome segregation ATPase
MRVVASSGGSIVNTLDRARRELALLAAASEVEIQSLTRGFEDLAGQASAILTLASAIIETIESDGVRSVLPSVQSLGSAARHFVEDRLHSTTGILDTVNTEVNLLRHLSRVADSQATIALKTRVLTMLTNVEVGRLGPEGSGFQYLATELSKFSNALSDDTEELADQTDTRRTAIEATRRVLSAEIPQLRAEFTRIDVHIEEQLASLESGLTRLSGIPLQFKSCVEEIAQQIAGVVAAVQSHDITRQQLEHVQDAFTLIGSELREGRQGRGEVSQEQARAHAGVSIQIYQLQNIRASITNWTTQIRSCMGVILSASATGLAGISPLVLEQEQQASIKLAHIEQLECESHRYSERIRQSVGGHSSLLALVGEHVERAKVVRQLLHLLSLNSIVEASRLGDKANAILEIGKGITSLSSEWGEITDQSEHAMQEILALVDRTSTLLEAFSDDGHQELRTAQAQMRGGLASLREAAAFTAGQARKIQAATERMQALGSSVGQNGDRLDAAYGRVDAVLAEIEEVRRQMEDERPGIMAEYDTAELERLYSISYTTEIERAVLHAALLGLPLPESEAISAGNDVELF